MRVLLDACVIYQAAVRDLLLHLAAAGMLDVHWSRRILDEAVRALRERRPDLEAARLERMCRRMDETFPEALVEPGAQPFGELAELPDPADRHVVEAAIAAGADAIVTWNAADFPPDVLASFGLEAVTPDALPVDLFDEDPDTVLDCMREIRGQLKSPPLTPSQYVANLRRQGLAALAGRVVPHLDRL